MVEPTSLLLVKVQRTVATLFQTTPYIVSSIMEKAVENGLDQRGEINDFKKCETYLNTIIE